MTNLFHYNTLKVSLEKSTRTLKILLSQNSLNQEMLFELETIFNWVAGRVEIDSIFLSSTSDTFCDGLDWEEIGKWDGKKISKIFERVRKLSLGMLHLPQTVVVDLKKSAHEVGMELSLGADIRLIQKEGHYSFNHLQKGFTPACGAFNLLPCLVGQTFARKWLMSSAVISSEEMFFSGFATIYQTGKEIHQTLMNIHQQSPVSRIQSKLGFLQNLSFTVNETQITAPALMIQDWQEFLMAHKEKREPEFMPAKYLREVLNKYQEQQKAQDH